MSEYHNLAVKQRREVMSLSEAEIQVLASIEEALSNGATVKALPQKFWLSNVQCTVCPHILDPISL